MTILQRAENLTERPAAEAGRTRIDSVYLLGLGLDDPGFDHTVLAEFRTRVAGQAGGSGPTPRTRSRRWRC